MLLQANRAFGAMKILGNQAVSGARKVYNDAKTIDVLAASKRVRSAALSGVTGKRGMAPLIGMGVGAVGGGYADRSSGGSGIGGGMIGAAAGFGTGMGATYGLGGKVRGAYRSAASSMGKAWHEAAPMNSSGLRPGIRGLLSAPGRGGHVENMGRFSHAEQFATDEAGRIKGNGFLMGAL